MPLFSHRSKTVLRSLHCLSVCGWIGGGLAVLVLLKLAGAPGGYEDAEAFQASITAIDDDLIIPSAGLAVSTGLLLCLAKSMRFTEHRWIAEKCLITALLLVFGAFWLRPDLQSLAFRQSHWLRDSTAAIIQTVGLLILVGLSMVKPEKRRPSQPAGRDQGICRHGQSRKPISEIRSNKRASYLRRYAIPGDLESRIRGNLDRYAVDGADANAVIAAFANDSAPETAGTAALQWKPAVDALLANPS